MGDITSIGASVGAYPPRVGASSPKTGGRNASGGGASSGSAQADGAAWTGSAAGTTAAGATTGAQSAEAQQSIQKLKQSDANVRQHEAAHQAAGGGHAGSASFTYTRGPDGKNYATAGEVQIDISAEAEPSATIAKMEQVKAAALAPSDPSAQDVRVASQADALKLKAQSEQRSAGGSADSGSKSGDSRDGESASPAQAARGMAAYGAAQMLGSPASFGAARGAGLVV